MKYLDMVGNEIKEGDFVVNATSCTGHGYLRRSLITKLGNYNSRWNNSRWNNNYYKDFHALKLKSIIISNHGKYIKDQNGNKKHTYVDGAHVGNSQQLAKHDNDIVKFNVIKLNQNIEEIFTPKELEYIGKTKIKLKV